MDFVKTVPFMRDREEMLENVDQTSAKDFKDFYKMALAKIALPIISWEINTLAWNALKVQKSVIRVISVFKELVTVVLT